jgi:hypothetical protein
MVYDRSITRSSKKISYLEVSLESTGGRNKHRTKQMIKGNQTLIAIYKNT